MINIAINALKNERGIAMVLALSMVALLSLLAIWLLLGSGSALRITAAATRHESAFNLAEGALDLCLRRLKDKRGKLEPSHANIITDPTLPIEDDMLPGSEDLGKGSMTSQIRFIGLSNSEGYSTENPGYGGGHRKRFYEVRGQGRIPLSSVKGDAAVTVARIVSMNAR